MLLMCVNDLKTLQIIISGIRLAGFITLGQPGKATGLFRYAIEAVPEMPVFPYHMGMSLFTERKRLRQKPHWKKPYLCPTIT